MTQNKIVPLWDNVHIRKPREAMETESGIILPAEERKHEFQGTVLGVGPDVKHVKVGDVILYKQYTSSQVYGRPNEYFVAERDILLKF